MFAAADRRLVAAVLVAVAMAAITIFLIASLFTTHRRKTRVPASMRPGPSDEELEARTLPRFLAVGAVFMLFLSAFLPGYWLREPTRIDQKVAQFNREAIERGRRVYEPGPEAGEAEEGPPHFAANCAACHGREGEGGVQPFRQYFSTAEPPLKYIVSRYKEAGRNDDEIKRIIYDAIERGRPGTLMPTWGLLYGGPLNSQQVDDVVAFIFSIQEEFPKPDKALEKDGAALFEANCAVCHKRSYTDDLDTRRDPSDPERVWGGVGPDLRSVMSQLYTDDIFDIIHDGKLNPNRPSMPSWAALGDTAIRSLIKFLESIQTGPIKGPRPSPKPKPKATATAVPSPGGSP